MKPPKERDVMRDVLGWLRLRRIWHQRMNVGAVKRGERYIRFASAGAADIWACVAGRLVVIEVKRPGQTAKPHQMQWLRIAAEAGALACVVTSSRQLEVILREEKMIP